MIVDQTFGVVITAKPLQWSNPASGVYISKPDLYVIQRTSRPTRWWLSTRPGFGFLTLTEAQAAANAHFTDWIRANQTQQYTLTMEKREDTTVQYMTKLVDHVAGLPLIGAAGTPISIPDKMTVAKEVIQYIIDNPT